LGDDLEELMSRPRRTPPPAPPPGGGKSLGTNRAFAALVALLDLDQQQVADKLHIVRGSVSAYVSGKKKLQPDNFRSKCAAFGPTPAAVAEKLLALAAELDAEGEPGQATPTSAGVISEIGREAERLAAGLSRKVRQRAAEKARRQALDLWKEIKKLEVHEWRLLAAAAAEVRSWAFVKLVGEESARAASVDARRALELARFSLWVAERVPGEEGWVCRVFAWAFLANAWRAWGATSREPRRPLPARRASRRTRRKDVPSFPSPGACSTSKPHCGSLSGSCPRPCGCSTGRRRRRPGRARSGHGSCASGRTLWSGWRTRQARSRRCGKRWPRSTLKPSPTSSICSNSTSRTA
jgi:predicted transcriptional regulator